MFILNKNQDYIYSDSYSKNIIAGFGTKQMGDGREKNLFTHYFKDQVLVTPKQIHSTNVVEYKSGENTAPDRCDGVITKERNVVLTVITADCLPIIYYDSVSEIIGISHQGWQGTLSRLPSIMIDRMIELGGSAENIHCVFGPAINDCCYEIFGERLNKFQKEFNSDLIFRKQGKNYFLNLSRANYLSLRASGISTQNIIYLPFCTSCDSEKFWSYHRDREINGEMLTFTMRR